MALLVLGTAIVAGAGVSALVNFSDVESQIRGEIGMGLVDAAVDDGDADAFTHGGVPGAVPGGAGGVVSVAADLLDGPALWGGGVVGIVGRGWGRRWRRKNDWSGGDDRATGGESPYDRRGWGERLRSAFHVGGFDRDGFEA